MNSTTQKTSGPTPVLPAYLRQRQLMQLLPFSASTLWRKSKQGTFPPAVRLSARVTAWNRMAVESWLAAQEAK